MAAGKLHCSVVTPERPIFDVDVDRVIVPIHDGEVGILPGHARFLAKLGIGELRLVTGSRIERLFLEGGFVEVADDVVTVLTDRACEIEELDFAEARERVERLRSQPGKGEELAAAGRRLLNMERVRKRIL
jgi:F-type H+-transporting ATPase subunit epsilon